MHALDTARQLARDIQETEEYREYAAAKEAIAGDEGIRALIREYKKLQMSVQMGAVTGHPASDEDNRRFQALCSLLFADSRTNGFLMSEMRMQQMMAEIFGILTKASGIDLEMPV